MSPSQSPTFRTPLETLEHWAQTQPQSVYLRQFTREGSTEFTWAEVLTQARRVAAFLREQNFPPRSHIAIFSKNCAEWTITDFGIWLAGHVSVPLYPNLEAPSVRAIMDHCEARLIFVGKLDRWSQISQGIPAGLPGVSFPYDERAGYTPWREVMARAPQPELDAHPGWDDLATLIYTSGTTGAPKGVMHSFRAMGRTAALIQRQLGFGPDERFFSYLPLAHVAERLLVQMISLYVGGTVSFADGLESFARDLVRTRPTIFLGVPRIWARFQSGLFKKMDPRKLARLMRIPLVRNIVGRRILRGMGLDASTTPVSGAAPTPPELLRWFVRLGLPIQEAYGMTENFAYSHLNRAGRAGWVGQALPEVECKLSPEGEVLVRGPGTMLGYFKDPTLSAEMLTADNFLRTGDLGEINSDGYLRITGRVKDLFKTSKGKYVAPVPIELKLGENPWVDCACVMGTGLAQPIAVITVHRQPSGHAGGTALSPEQSNEQMRRDLRQLVSEVNASLDAHERLVKIVVVSDAWSVENGLLTPTLKVKRQQVENRYGQLLEGWCRDREPVLQYVAP